MSEPKPMPAWWAEHERRSMDQRNANEAAFRASETLPYPNPWDVWDPTKLPRDASPEAYQESYKAFRKRCQPKPRKRHIL